jgi:hypothetical protein
LSKKAPTYKEIKNFIIRVMNFTFKSSGRHENYEGFFRGKRRVVQLDSKHDKLPPDIQKRNFSSMIKQMGFNNKSDNEFQKLFYEKKENLVIIPDEDLE